MDSSSIYSDSNNFRHFVSEPFPIKAGDKVLCVTKADSYKGANREKECFVRKVGRKYFYVSEEMDSDIRSAIQIEKSTFCTPSDSWWQSIIFKDAESYHKETERIRGFFQLKLFFNEYNSNGINELKLETINACLELLGLKPPL